MTVSLSLAADVDPVSGAVTGVFPDELVEVPLLFQNTKDLLSCGDAGQMDVSSFTFQML